MVEGELGRRDLSSSGLDALKVALVCASDAEMQCKVIAFDSQVPDLPLPVGKCNDQGLELGGDFARAAVFVVYSQWRRVE